MMARAGVVPEAAFHDKDNRALSFACEGGDVRIIRVRAFDVATFVAHRRGAGRDRRLRRGRGIRLFRALRARSISTSAIAGCRSPSRRIPGSSRLGKVEPPARSRPNIRTSPAASSSARASRPSASSSTARWSSRRALGPVAADRRPRLERAHAGGQRPGRKRDDHAGLRRG